MFLSYLNIEWRPELQSWSHFKAEAPAQSLNQTGSCLGSVQTLQGLTGHLLFNRRSDSFLFLLLFLKHIFNLITLSLSVHVELASVTLMKLFLEYWTHKHFSTLLKHSQTQHGHVDHKTRFHPAQGARQTLTHPPMPCSCDVHVHGDVHVLTVCSERGLRKKTNRNDVKSGTVDSALN